MFSTFAVSEDAVKKQFVIYGIIHVMALRSPLLPSQWHLTQKNCMLNFCLLKLYVNKLRPLSILNWQPTNGSCFGMYTSPKKACMVEQTSREECSWPGGLSTHTKRQELLLILILVLVLCLLPIPQISLFWTTGGGRTAIRPTPDPTHTKSADSICSSQSKFQRKYRSPCDYLLPGNKTSEL